MHNLSTIFLLTGTHMEKTRELIIAISKKDKAVKKMVKQFQRAELTEDELVFNVLSHLTSELNDYKEEEMRIGIMTW